MEETPTVADATTLLITEETSLLPHEYWIASDLVVVATSASYVLLVIMLVNGMNAPFEAVDLVLLALATALNLTNFWKQRWLEMRFSIVPALFMCIFSLLLQLQSMKVNKPFGSALSFGALAFTFTNLLLLERLLQQGGEFLSK